MSDKFIYMNIRDSISLNPLDFVHYCLSLDI